MAATLILVRHAAHIHLNETLSGRMPGVPLSEAGRAQADRLAARLAERRPLMVHTSPADRAFETALTIFHRTDTGLATVEALNEIDFGAWTGRSFVDLGEDPDWRKWNNERASSRPPNGESMVEAQARIVAHLESTAREWTGGTVILVSHADMIRAAVCHVLEMQLGAFWRFDVDAASATTLEWNDWGGRLVSLNERSGERPLASFPSPRA